ncbi:hypothetical protein, partial [Streptomyces phytophilus]|uniref:hypothetical protein n=1 Tax=Streptomyces phytophilus TaxID=722715 RepID=UPI0015F0DAA6
EQLTDPAYWTEHIRTTVHYATTAQTLHHAGVTTYLEAGPDTTLTTLTQQTLSTSDHHHIPLLRRDTPEPHTLTAALARLHTAGTPLRWPPTPLSGKPVPLPTYAFQHQTFWLEGAAAGSDATRLG